MPRTKSDIAQLLVMNLPQGHRIRKLNLDYGKDEIYFQWGELNGKPLEWIVSLPMVSVWRPSDSKGSKQGDAICDLMQDVLKRDIHIVDMI